MFTPKKWKGGTYNIEQLQSLYKYITPSQAINNLQNINNTIIGISSISAEDVSSIKGTNADIATIQAALNNQFEKTYSFQANMVSNLQSYVSSSGFDIFDTESQNNYDSEQISSNISSLVGLSTRIVLDNAALPLLEYIQASTLASYQTKYNISTKLQSTYSGLLSSYSTIESEYISSNTQYIYESTMLGLSIMKSYSSISDLMLHSTALGAISDLYILYTALPEQYSRSTAMGLQVEAQNRNICTLQTSIISQDESDISTLSGITVNMSLAIAYSTMLIEQITSTMNWLSTEIGLYNLSTSQYNTYKVSSAAQVAALEAIYLHNLHLQNLAMANYTEASTFVALNSSLAMLHIVNDLIQEASNGDNVNYEVSTLVKNQLGHPGTSADLDTLYRTLSTLVAIQNAAHETALANLNTLNMQSGGDIESASNVLTISKIYDIQIDAETQIYNGLVADRRESTNQLVDSLQIYNRLLLSSVTSTLVLAQYDRDMNTYLKKADSLKTAIGTASQTVVSLNNQISLANTTFNEYQAYVSSYSANQAAIQTNITNNMNAIADAAIQKSDYSTVLGNMQKGDFTGLTGLSGPLQIMYQNAIAFDQSSADVATSLSTLYSYDYSNMTGMLLAISTQMTADTTMKQLQIATDNIMMLTAISSLGSEISAEVSSLSTKRYVIDQFFPLFQPLYDYISSEYLNKVAYKEVRRVYEHQSYLKLAPPGIVKETILNDDDFHKLQYIYDLLVQEVNTLLDTKKVYVEKVFRPRLEYILNNVLDPAQLIFLNSPVAYQDLNNNNFIVSSILPFSISYIYLDRRSAGLVSADSIIPTTTTEVCVSTIGQSSITLMKPDVVLRSNTDFIAPTTTADTRSCGVRGRYIQISKADNDLEIMQIVVIDKTGKNVAFGKKATIIPALLQRLHAADLNYITNGNYSRQKFMSMVESMNSHFYTRYMFVSPSVEGANVPFSKIVTIDLEDTYDITAIQYLKFMNEYTSAGIQISIADESRSTVATQSLTQNTEKETLDFTDDSQVDCPLDIVPLRNGTCGILARFVRIYASVPTNTNLPATTTAATTTVAATTTLAATTTVATTTGIPQNILDQINTTLFDTIQLYFTSTRANSAILTNDKIGDTTGYYAGINFYIAKKSSSLFNDFVNAHFTNDSGSDLIFNFNMYWSSPNSNWGLVFNVYNSSDELQTTINTPVINPQIINQNIPVLNNNYFTISWIFSNGSGTYIPDPYAIPISLTVYSFSVNVGTPVIQAAPTNQTLVGRNIVVYDTITFSYADTNTNLIINNQQIRGINITNLSQSTGLFNNSGQFTNNSGKDLVVNCVMQYTSETNSAWGLSFTVYNSAGIQNVVNTSIAPSQTIDVSFILFNGNYFTISWVILNVLDILINPIPILFTVYPYISNSDNIYDIVQLNYKDLDETIQNDELFTADNIKIKSQNTDLFTNINSGKFLNNTGFNLTVNFNMTWKSPTIYGWGLTFNVYNYAGILNSTNTTPIQNSQTINQNISLPANTYFTITWVISNGNSFTFNAIPITLTVYPSFLTSNPITPSPVLKTIVEMPYDTLVVEYSSTNTVTKMISLAGLLSSIYNYYDTGRSKIDNIFGVDLLLTINILPLGFGSISNFTISIYNSSNVLQNRIIVTATAVTAFTQSVILLATNYMTFTGSFVSLSTVQFFIKTYRFINNIVYPTTILPPAITPRFTYYDTSTALFQNALLIRSGDPIGYSTYIGGANVVFTNNENGNNLFATIRGGGGSNNYINNTGSNLAIIFSMGFNASAAPSTLGSLDQNDTRQITIQNNKIATWGLTFNIYSSSGVLLSTITTAMSNSQTIQQNITLLNNQYFTVSWVIIKNGNQSTIVAPNNIPLTITSYKFSDSINVTGKFYSGINSKYIKNNTPFTFTNTSIMSATNNIPGLFTNFNINNQFNNNTGYNAIFNFNMIGWNAASTTNVALTFKVYNATNTLISTVTTPTALTFNQTITLLNNQYFTITFSNITVASGIYTNLPVTFTLTLQPSDLYYSIVSSALNTYLNLLYDTLTGNYQNQRNPLQIKPGEIMTANNTAWQPRGLTLFNNIIYNNSSSIQNFVNDSGKDLSLNFNISYNSNVYFWGLIFNIYNSYDILQDTVTTGVAISQTINQIITLLNGQYFTITWLILKSDGNGMTPPAQIPITITSYLYTQVAPIPLISPTTTVASSTTTTTVPQTTTVAPVFDNALYRFIFSQLAVIDSNRNNIAINKMVRFFTGGQPTPIPASLVNRTYYQALPIAACYTSPVITDNNTYVEIDLGSESDVTAVHIYNTSDINNYQKGLKVQLYTEDKLLATETNVLTNNRKEIIPFIGFNVDSNCSMEPLWPPYYGIAGLITRYVRLIQTQPGSFGFSKIEIIDKNGRDIALFKPVTATSNQTQAYLGVSNRNIAVSYSSCYVASSTTTIQSYIIDLQWEHEICAINVYGCTDIPSLTNNINIDLFRQLGTSLATRPLQGSKEKESFDFRYIPEESNYPVAVIPEASVVKNGAFGTMCDTITIPFRVLTSDTNAAIVESTGRNLFTGATINYSSGNTIITIGYMADITCVTMSYDSAQISTRIELTDCQGNQVARQEIKQFPTNNQIMYADFRGPSLSNYAPLQPLPIRYGPLNKGIMAQYIRIIPRDAVTPLYISQIIAVDSSGNNVSLEADAFTVDDSVRQNASYAVDGVYEAKMSDSDWLQMFFTKYRQKLASASFVSNAGIQERNFLILNLGDPYEINSIIYIVTAGYNKSAQGVIVQLMDSNYKVVGVQLVSQLATSFGVDILDFRKDRTESYLNPNAGLEIIQRDPVLGKTGCGILAQYIRVEQLSGSQPIQLSQLIAIDSYGFNVALYKPTFSTSNNTNSYTIVDGSYYEREVEDAFISASKPAEYIEVNLTREFEIVNIYAINLRTDPNNNFGNMRVVLYNKHWDIVMGQNTQVDLNAGLSTNDGNPALTSFSNYPQITKIGVSLQSNLMDIKSNLGLASVFANAGQSIPTPPVEINLVSNTLCASDLSSAPRFIRGPNNGVPTRKIRIYNARQYIQISQIMAYTADGRNVALRKPCTASSVLPGLYVSRITDGQEGVFHTPRPESQSYVSGLKRYNYVTIDLQSDYEIIGVKYVPTNANFYRNVGLSIQLLNEDDVFLAQYVITQNQANGVLIDFRFPIGLPIPIAQAIMPSINTLSITGTTPNGITEDLLGNLYYTEMNSGSIYNKTTGATVINTLRYPAGLTCDGTNLYVADYGNGVVKKIVVATSTVYTVPLTGITVPYAVYYNSGMLYCSEYKMGGRIFVYNTAQNTFIILTQTFNFPSSILMNRDSLLYIASAYDKIIYTIPSASLGTGVIAQIGLNLPISISFSSPSSLAYDNESNILFIADYTQARVYSIDKIGSVNIIAGTGTAGYSGDGSQGIFAAINKPNSLFYSRIRGWLLISDYGNGVIRYVNTVSAPPLPVESTTTYQAPSYYATTTLQLTDIQIQEILTSINNTTINTYSVLSSKSAIQNTYTHSSYIDSFVLYNKVIYFTSNYILYSYNNGAIIILGGTGQSGYSGDGTRNFQIGTIKCMAVNNNMIYLCDYDYSVVRAFNILTGIITSFLGTRIQHAWVDGLKPLETSLKNPTWIGFDNNNIFYVSDTGNYCIRRINSTNRVQTIVGKGSEFSSIVHLANVQSNSIMLNRPTGFAFDQNNNLIFCDSGSNMIYIVNKESRMQPLCGNGTTPLNTIDGSAAASSVSLNNPYGLAIDIAGTIYVSSYNTNQIFKIVQDPIYLSYSVSNIVGNGNTAGRWNSADMFSRYASLYNPTIIQVLPDKSFYFLDYSNKMIRYVLPDLYNTINVPPQGILPYSPIITIANIIDSGNLYNTSVFTNGEEGIALLNNFASKSMCSDSAGNLYVCNTTRNNILRINTTGNIILFASGFSNPRGICIYNNSILYISDKGTNTIKSININQLGTVNTLTTATDPQTNAVHNMGYLLTIQPLPISIHIYNINTTTSTTVPLDQTPYAIAIDNNNNVYISTGNSIIVYTLIIGDLPTLSSTYRTFVSNLGMCYSITYNNSNIYYSSSTQMVIYSKRATDIDGNTGTIIAGSLNIKGNIASGSYASTVSFNNPFNIVFDSNNTLYILDLINTTKSTIHKIPSYNILMNALAYNITGSDISQQITTGQPANILAPFAFYGDIHSTAFGPDGSIYISDKSNHCIWKLDTTGRINIYVGTGVAGSSGVGGSATLAKLNNPLGIVVGNDGTLYICDSGNNRVVKIVNINGTNTLSVFTSSIISPVSIVFDSNNNAYISASTQIYKVNILGMTSIYVGGGSSTPANGLSPLAVQLSQPGQLAINSSNELYFINLNQVLKVASTGLIAVVAGSGSAGFSTDGTLATLATVSSPGGLAIDANNTVYISDSGNNIIRVISNGNLLTVAGGNTSISNTAIFSNSASFSNFAAFNAFYDRYRPIGNFSYRCNNEPDNPVIVPSLHSTASFDLSFFDGNTNTIRNNTGYTATFIVSYLSPTITGTRFIWDQGYRTIQGYTFYSNFNFRYGPGPPILYNEIVADIDKINNHILFNIYNSSGILYSTIAISEGTIVTLLNNQYATIEYQFPIKIRPHATFPLSRQANPLGKTLPINGFPDIIRYITGDYKDEGWPESHVLIPDINFSLILVNSDLLEQLTAIFSNSVTTNTPTIAPTNYQLPMVTPTNPSYSIRIPEITTVIPPNKLFNNVQNIYGLGQIPKNISLNSPRQLSIDSNSRLLVTQAVPNLTLIPYVSNVYVNNDAFGVSNVRYIKIRGNGLINIKIEISQIVICNNTGNNIAKNAIFTSYSNSSTLSNMIDNCFSCKLNTYLSNTSANEYVLIDLQANTTVTFVLWYMGLYNKAANNNILLDLLDSNKSIIVTRTVQNVIDLPSSQYISFNFMLNALVKPLLLNDIFKLNKISNYKKKIRYIRINTGGANILGISQIVVKSHDDGSNLAPQATISYYNGPSDIPNNVINMLLQNTINDMYTNRPSMLCYVAYDSTSYIQLDLGLEYNISDVIIYTPEIIAGQQNPYNYTVSGYGADGIRVTNSNQFTIVENGVSGLRYPYTYTYTFNSQRIPILYSSAFFSDPYFTNINTAKYVRIQNPGSTITISQIAVYDIYGVNLAVGKPIRTNTEVTNAYILVNNNISTTPTNYITSSYSTDWFEIDLCNMYTIASIVIYASTTQSILTILYDNTYTEVASPSIIGEPDRPADVVPVDIQMYTEIGSSGTIDSSNTQILSQSSTLFTNWSRVFRNTLNTKLKFIINIVNNAPWSVNKPFWAPNYTVMGLKLYYNLTTTEGSSHTLNNSMLVPNDITFILNSNESFDITYYWGGVWGSYRPTGGPMTITMIVYDVSAIDAYNAALSTYNAAVILYVSFRKVNITI